MAILMLMLMFFQHVPDLTVTLHDVNGSAIAGVTVQIRDRSGTTVRASAQTDATGTAVFPVVSDTAIRVLVLGQLANGTVLALPGADANGIAAARSGSTRLDLLVDPQTGVVALDPQTMWALEQNGPLIATAPAVLPTAVQSQPIIIATDVAATIEPVGQVVAATAPTLSTMVLWVFGIGLCVMLVLVGVAIILFQRRWNEP